MNTNLIQDITCDAGRLGTKCRDKLTVGQCKINKRYMNQDEINKNGCLDWKKQIEHDNIGPCRHLRRTKGRG